MDTRNVKTDIFNRIQNVLDTELVKYTIRKSFIQNAHKTCIYIIKCMVQDYFSVMICFKLSYYSISWFRGL